MLLAALLGSCSSPPPPVAAPARTPTSTAVATKPHGERIRFALIGAVTPANVWALFDSRGHTYNNYAVRGGYWPRLFGLSISDEQFETEAASAMPSAMQQEGGFYTSTVPLRTNLAWSDGVPFTASDVAFTINTSLKFQLGFDWHDYYNPDVLDHAQALDPGTVKFFFKRAPDVGEWQYGALQGPVVQEKFWASSVATATPLLPPEGLVAGMEASKAQIADAQARLDALYAQAAIAQKEAARQVQASIKREQGNLDEATNNLAEAQQQYDEAMQAARNALYTLDDSGEPLLGKWEPAGPGDASGTFENTASADFAADSSFDRAGYTLYPTRAAALAALDKGEVDVVLDPSAPDASADENPAMVSPNRDLRFLVLDVHAGPFKETILRQALACMIDQSALAGTLGSQALPNSSFIPVGKGAWYAADAQLPCGEMDAASRLAQASQMLKAAGYTWARAPSAEEAGEGLTSPDGQALPPMHLMTPAEDELRSTAAHYAAQQAQLLGIPLTDQVVTADVIDYAVFSSGQFDAAVLGWKVSHYPGYLCDWFGAGGPFEYAHSQVTSLCGELRATSDLGTAQAKIHDIQVALVRDAPMIPLFSGVVRDMYRNVTYPFRTVLGGLAGVYGAPALAVPALP
jgi:peptide/nickel transport system substrate-binding protein